MQKSKSVKIYYDRECGFCRRSVYLITKYFLVRATHTGPAQERPEIYKVMQEKDSWVVENDRGEIFTTFQAGVEIARHSPILFVFVPLAGPGFMKRFGEWVYRKIANNRSRIPLP